MPSSPLAIWEFPPDADPEVMASILLDRKDDPDARGLLVSSRGAVLTVQLVEGTVVDRSSTFHVEGRGGHVLERREVWPSREPGEAPRELLVLRASAS